MLSSATTAALQAYLKSDKRTESPADPEVARRARTRACYRVDYDDGSEGVSNLKRVCVFRNIFILAETMVQKKPAAETLTNRNLTLN